MICHKHRCIFVHIPRCAGTSMEISVIGHGDRLETKHLIASTAKEMYKEYWNDYFKFSFVRNPWDRMVSMAKFEYGVRLDHRLDEISFPYYFEQYSPIEIDRRTPSRDDTFSPINNAVYLNILNEDLDFIGKFENIQEDWAYVCSQIGKAEEPLKNDQEHQFKHKPYRVYYREDTKKIIADAYAKDIDYFNYSF